MDEAGAISRTNDNTDLYERLLRKFREREAEFKQPSSAPNRVAQAMQAWKDA